MATESQALVPAQQPLLRAVGRSPARLGLRALVKLSGSPMARRAAMTGLAFGVGYQLSRMVKTGRLSEVAYTARNAYRAASGSDPVAEGELAGRWVRQSVTLVSSFYGYVDRDD